MGIIYNSLTPSEGLVLSLDTANRRSYPGSGNTWFDLSGNGNNGTLTNGASLNTGPGGGMNFDGVDDNTQVSLKYYGTGTVSFWCKPDLDNGTTSFCFGLTASSVERFIIGLGNGFTGTLTNEIITVAAVNSAGNARIEGYTTATRTEIFNSNWHHIAIVQRTANASYEIYLDGSRRTTTVGSSVLGSFGIGTPNSDLVILGAQRLSAAQADFSKGQLDDIRLYSRALSESEIRILFNSKRRRYGL